MVYMKNSSPWFEGSRCYEQLWMTWTTPSLELRFLDTLTSLRLLFIWKALCHQLKALNAMYRSGLGIEMNNFESWAKGSRCYQQLKAMVAMNDYGSWAEGSRCYEQLRDMDDMNEFESWAQGFRYYTHLKVVDDMNDIRSWAKGSRCYQ